MSKKKFSLGLDFGTNSVRALIVDIANGEEIATYVYNYRYGRDGILLDKKDTNVARQSPRDYIEGLEHACCNALQKARKNKGFSPGDIIGIGVDTTGSTPIPVDKEGIPLAFNKEFKNNLNAQAWLWKDHSGYEEAEEITALARKEKPQYLAKCGGTYSSEWFFSKVLHCLRCDSKVFKNAYSWVELADFIPGVLAGNTKPLEIKRGICAAGHKAMCCEEWGGLPEKTFLAKLDPKLGELRRRLYKKAYPSDVKAGGLSKEYAKKLGLKEGIAVAVGAFDAHMGAVGAGIEPGTLVKIIGTSTCDMMVVPDKEKLQDIPGLCGIVDGSILPGYFGLEAGQSAVGDIFNWFVNLIKEDKKLGANIHKHLTEKSRKLKPGESGLLALDWNNGNRTVLVDAKLTGLLIGQTLHTTAEEIYRTLIEATAFGARVIIERFEEYGAHVKDIINCGGIAEKNSLLMQIYADITGRPMKVSRSSQTCALGACMFGAVAAGKGISGFSKVEDAQKAMSGLKDKKYVPQKKAHAVYNQLYKLYLELHDSFGGNRKGNLKHIMKELLKIKNEVIKNEK